MSLTQFVYLLKRDIHATRRTPGTMLMVFLLPAFLWAFQIVLPLIRLGIVAAQASQQYLTTSLVNEQTNPLDASIDLGMPAMIALILTFMSVIP